MEFWISVQSYVPAVWVAHERTTMGWVMLMGLGRLSEVHKPHAHLSTDSVIWMSITLHSTLSTNNHSLPEDLPPLRICPPSAILYLHSLLSLRFLLGATFPTAPRSLDFRTVSAFLPAPAPRQPHRSIGLERHIRAYTFVPESRITPPLCASHCLLQAHIYHLSRRRHHHPRTAPVPRNRRKEARNWAHLCLTSSILIIRRNAVR